MHPIIPCRALAWYVWYVYTLYMHILHSTYHTYILWSMDTPSHSV
jgi:hypothetical protein